MNYLLILMLLSSVGFGYTEYCSSDRSCEHNIWDTKCCSNFQCCSDYCTANYDCSGTKPYCCSDNNRCCSTFSSDTIKTTGEKAGVIAGGVIIAICVVVAVVIIGCCVGIVLCCRRQTNYSGRVVRAPATTTVHTTHTVMQPNPYQPGVPQQYPAAPNKDQPPAYVPPAYNTAAPSYPSMPQPAMNPNMAPYPSGAPPYGAPPYPMGPQVQENAMQATAPPIH